MKNLLTLFVCMLLVQPGVANAHWHKIVEVDEFDNLIKVRSHIHSSEMIPWTLVVSLVYGSDGSFSVAGITGPSAIECDQGEELTVEALADGKRSSNFTVDWLGSRMIFFRDSDSIINLVRKTEQLKLRVNGCNFVDEEMAFELASELDLNV